MQPVNIAFMTRLHRPVLAACLAACLAAVAPA
jgi:hypothetical protein